MRLIDADAFYEKMNDLSKYHEGVYNGAINDCMNLLDNEPTAYDVEAVVAEMEKHMDDARMWDEDDFYDGKARAYECAISIVRGKE